MTTYVSAKPLIDEDDVTAVVEVLRSGHLEEGEHVRLFEEKIGGFLTKEHAQATVNGFSAIHILLLSLGVAKDDEIIVPSYCCPAVVYPIKLIGAKPVFADIGENSLNMTSETIGKVYTKRTRLVILPYQFGFPTDVDTIVAQFGVDEVIEDVAQALGGTYRRRQLGAYASHAVTSFYSTKMMTCGDAGMLLTAERAVYETARELTYYGGRRGYQSVGYNYHLTNLNAALGVSQFRKLNQFVEKRKKLGQMYRTRLAGCREVWTGFRFGEDAVFSKFPILLPSESIRDKLKSALSNRGINCGYGVLEALHVKEKQISTVLKNTEDFVERVLCLPIYPSMREEDAEFIAESVVKSLAGI